MRICRYFNSQSEFRNSRREWLADPGCFRTESNTSLAGFGLSPAEVKHAVLLATFSKPLLLAINHDPPSRHFDPFGTKFSVKPGQANHSLQFTKTLRASVAIPICLATAAT